MTYRYYHISHYHSKLNGFRHHIIYVSIKLKHMASFAYILILNALTVFLLQTKFLPLSGDCHVVSCARDGQIRLSELSSTGVCRATSKLAQHKGSAHSVSLARHGYVIISQG